MQAGQLQKNLEAFRQTATRLTIIDVGRDPAGLRRKYADRHRFMILPTVVDASIATRETKLVPGGRAWFLDPNRVHVALAWRPALKPFLPGGRSYSAPAVHPPRYEVTLAVGRDLQPWITEVRKLP